MRRKIVDSRIREALEAIDIQFQDDGVWLRLHVGSLHANINLGRRAKGQAGYDGIVSKALMDFAEKRAVALSSPAEESKDGEDVREIAEDAFNHWRAVRRDYSDVIKNHGVGDEALQAAAFIDGYSQAYAARAAAQTMPDLTGEIDMMREAIDASTYCVSDAEERWKWHEALNRINQAVKGPQPIDHPRRFETRSPGTSEVGGCDGSACVECATPCEQHLERMR
jgi:hypothetical protein